jgi:hypothetical protein
VIQHHPITLLLSPAQPHPVWIIVSIAIPIILLVIRVKPISPELLLVYALRQPIFSMLQQVPVNYVMMLSMDVQAVLLKLFH